MGNEINKIYNKAINCYQVGEYTKALQLCEEGISKDLKNTALLNLKGLLFYLNGDLKQATTLWNINRDYNNDEVSKVYLKDSKNDEENLKIFEEAENHIKELQIDDAIKKLEMCTKSDFNSINVNNALAICFIRKGEYEIARTYNDKAIEIDKRNIKSLCIREEIKRILKNPKDTFRQKIVASVISLVVVLSIVIIYFISVDINDKNYIVDSENVINDKVTEGVEEGEGVKEVLDVVKDETVVEGISINDDELKDIYVEGTNYFEVEDYDKAIGVLSKAVNNTNESYLNEHVLFLLAAAYDNNNNVENGIKYYEDYVNKYNNGNYMAEVYYKLAILYKGENNMVKSKEYAALLKNKHPESIYINTIVEEIISS